MPGTVFRWTINALTLGCLLLLFLIFTGQSVESLNPFAAVDAEQWQSVKTVFVSIVLEALPFLLLGVLVSSALSVFVSEDALRKILPRHPALAIGVACLFGIVLPVCECGMIPIVRRLIRKGMPAYAGVAYILAAPIVNPVTFFATYMAFRSDPGMAWNRTIAAFLVAVLIGLALYKAVRRNPLKEEHGREHEHHHHSHSHGHSHTHEHNHGYDTHVHAHSHAHKHGNKAAARKGNRFVDLFAHASDEFFEMGKYLLLGAFLTALIQAFVSRADLVDLSGGAVGPHLLLMGFAYLISLCSTSDAFIAASFNGLFPKSALLTFLVFGPMLDFKSTLMMLSAFRARFVAIVSLLVVIVVPLVTIVLSGID